MIALLLIIVALIGFYINRKKVVTISDDGIRYPFFIDKSISWTEIENIRLRDDILTIDLKNNQLFQSPVITGGPHQDEKAFNDYCLKRMKADAGEELLKEKT